MALLLLPQPLMVAKWTSLKRQVSISIPRQIFLHTGTMLSSSDLVTISSLLILPVVHPIIWLWLLLKMVVSMKPMITRAAHQSPTIWYTLEHLILIPSGLIHAIQLITYQSH